jgi:hypothetical protein
MRCVANACTEIHSRDSKTADTTQIMSREVRCKRVVRIMAKVEHERILALENIQ